MSGHGRPERALQSPLAMADAGSRRTTRRGVRQVAPVLALCASSLGGGGIDAAWCPTGMGGTNQCDPTTGSAIVSAPPTIRATTVSLLASRGCSENACDGAINFSVFSVDLRCDVTVFDIPGSSFTVD